MKKEVSPLVIIIAIVVVIAVVVFVFYKSSQPTEKPSPNMHPKDMRGRPGKGQRGGDMM